MYSFYFAYDFIHCIYTLWVIKSFRKPAGLLIMVSEVLVYFRHIAQWANFLDTANGWKMRQGAVDFWTNISFWSYILGTIIELALIVEPMFNVTNDEEPESIQAAGLTPSQELLDLNRGDEDIENHISKYNTKKTSKIDKDGSPEKKDKNGNPEK
jgi:hypothetical protein